MKLIAIDMDVEKLWAILTRRKDISLTTSGTEKLELGSPLASKGNTLKFMAKHFRIPLEETVAIGDNLNNFTMFENAGMSIAMGNAEDIVKKQATYITKDHDDDGVAYCLRKWVL